MTEATAAEASSPPATETLNAFSRLLLHPRGFWFVFWGELAERASFYGMRTVLALYLTDVLLYHESTASQIGTGFVAACYLTPLLGGWIADHWLGRFKTILYFSFPYILGHIILGGIETRPALFFALALLALGSGSIKPNTSVLMGQIYEQEKKEALLTEAFSYFYAAINVGAFISTLELPALRTYLIHRGMSKPEAYGYVLMVPAILMAVAFAIFAIGRRYYGPDLVRKASEKTPEQRRAEWDTLLKIAPIFALIAVFWFVYDQSASTWIYFARDHCTQLPGDVEKLSLLGGFGVTPDQVQALNPFLIVALTPFFNWLWNRLKRARGSEVPDTRKMLFGFVIVVGCMAMITLAAVLSRGGRVTVWWLMVATFVITLAELCVSVIGLEFAYRVAAPGTRSIVTAAFWCTVFVGDSVATQLDRYYTKPLAPDAFFAIQTATIIAATIAFWFVARRFERRSLIPANGPA